MVVYTVPRPEEPVDPSPGSGHAIGLESRGDSDGASVRRRELAVFLRSRRERMSPSELGIVAITRRRTPGLRREEVAQHAGMSVTWYTALEQARDVRPSPQVLNALARTLRLDHDERHHLYRLAGAADDAVVTECNAVSTELHAVLDKLDPYPACIQNGKFDLLAYNSAMRLLITDLDEVPIAQRNCVWLTFTEPRWRERIVDWEQAAARQVANLRVAMAEHVDDGRWKALVSRLRTESSEFAELWDRHSVRGVDAGVLRQIDNPAIGRMTFTVSNTWVAPGSTTRLQVLLPADPHTVERLTRLVADAG
ncbi:helix-turn-helix transcriptional regulator [Streptomyces mirabilis]|uniref:helix-turn-helix transcriptional regulator n=1 Tax=Streptomyces mirabilis TaxID=68239 RepID=UPI002255514C|nr:helix-turn-helix transcriptional regulator [Streptomyces mirabilis]MCX4427578.1 helix-turn-helix transcriptional regulator [Streptomyces mirabilis]